MCDADVIAVKRECKTCDVELGGETWIELRRKEATQ
jgi:hypothetical protein